jgi:hypothetical protein
MEELFETIFSMRTMPSDSKIWLDAVLKLRCNNRSAYIERPMPLLVEEEAPFLNSYMSRREQNSWSWISRSPEARNDCAGEAQQPISTQLGTELPRMQQT